jgi:hypothetical protein
MTRSELLSALLAAKEGSEELDYFVWSHLGHDLGLPVDLKFTSSIDAARTLINPGLNYNITYRRDGVTAAWIDLESPVYAATEPLALCVAAIVPKVNLKFPVLCSNRHQPKVADYRAV